MSPEEKAKELIDKYIFSIAQVFDKHRDSNYVNCLKAAIKCALICVDEIIKEVNGHNVTTDYKVEYWNEVKQHLNKTKN